MAASRWTSQMRIRALIIDDERPARELIEALLIEHDDIEVVGECADGRSAITAIKRSKPDLVFLDIRMPHLDGFGVLEKLDLESPPVVIFVTAYDRYAVRAFEINALDYLLKPIRRQRFAEAIARVRKVLQSERARSSSKLRGLLEHWDKNEGGKAQPVQSEYLQRIFVKDRRKSISVEVGEIEWIGSLDHFVEIHTGGRSYVLHEKLSALAGKLDPGLFFRIHRTRIVNLRAIERFAIDAIGNYTTHLSDGTTHRVARSRCGKLRELLAKG